jgi:MscS family membrane protein
VYLRIMDIVAGSGAYFAYPSQTLYLGRDGGKDADRTRESEAAVASWREAGEIPLPRFPENLIEELDDSIEYPPEGSAVGKKG